MLYSHYRYSRILTHFYSNSFKISESNINSLANNEHKVCSPGDHAIAKGQNRK